MSHKEFIVILASRADEMLLSHIKFLAQVSPAAARKLLSEFRSAKSRLAGDPYMFPYADELDVFGIPLKTYRKCIFYSRYKAIFLIEDNNVFVDAIIDCRQENRDLFE